MLIYVALLFAVKMKFMFASVYMYRIARLKDFGIHMYRTV